jgi:hypothetical protein
MSFGAAPNLVRQLTQTAFWAFAVTALLGRVIIPRIIEHF